MAGLYDHIRGTDDTGAQVDKLAIHQFTAASAETGRGEITKAQAAAIFPFLTGTALTEADTLIDAVIAGTLTRQEVADVLALAEWGAAPYDTEAAVKARLGF